MLIAAFTTGYGHLKLYDDLNHLQDSVLYHDTDSLVYVSKPGEYQLPLGDRLGELKDEPDRDFNVEFISSGSKSYVYKTGKNKVALKAKKHHIKL